MLASNQKSIVRMKKPVPLAIGPTKIQVKHLRLNPMQSGV